VWDLTTRIYSEIGQTVELSTVRDIVNSRIEAIDRQLAEEKKYIAEEIHHSGYLKPQHVIRCVTRHDLYSSGEEKEAKKRNEILALLGLWGKMGLLRSLHCDP
jgi:hypothetical protein